MRTLPAAVTALTLLCVPIVLPAPAAAQETSPVAAEAALPVVPVEFWWALDDLLEWLTMTLPDGLDRTLDDAAAEFGVDPDLLKAIVRCESGGAWWVANRTSGAAGLGQHLPRYYPGRAREVGYPEHRIDPFRPRQNARVTAWLLAEQGTRPWNASKHCWG